MLAVLVILAHPPQLEFSSIFKSKVVFECFDALALFNLGYPD